MGVGEPLFRKLHLSKGVKEMRPRSRLGIGFQTRKRPVQGPRVEEAGTVRNHLGDRVAK